MLFKRSGQPKQKEPTQQSKGKETCTQPSQLPRMSFSALLSVSFDGWCKRQMGEMLRGVYCSLLVRILSTKSADTVRRAAWKTEALNIRRASIHPQGDYAWLLVDRFNFVIDCLPLAARKLRGIFIAQFFFLSLVHDLVYSIRMYAAPRFILSICLSSPNPCWICVLLISLALFSKYIELLESYNEQDCLQGLTLNPRLALNL